MGIVDVVEYFNNCYLLGISKVNFNFMGINVFNFSFFIDLNSDLMEYLINDDLIYILIINSQFK